MQQSLFFFFLFFYALKQRKEFFKIVFSVIPPTLYIIKPLIIKNVCNSSPDFSDNDIF